MPSNESNPQPVVRDVAAVLALITVFRRWRSGAITTDEMLSRLDEDDLADVLGCDHHQEQR